MKTTKDLLRELEALKGPFQRFNTNDLPESPSDLFIDWLNIAIEKAIYEPHKMILSTVDETGAPDARTLILKNLTDNKWYFSTSDISRKGKQLESNMKVALTFYWSELGRQVRIRGEASKMSAEASLIDFLERSIGGRAEALIGNQSQQLKCLHDLDEAFAKSKELIKQSPDIISPNWTLYSVDANEVEFWQGDSERKHIRVQYQRNNNNWTHQLLWP